MLGWSAVEIAACLEVSTPAVTSALQRARTTLGSVQPSEDRATVLTEHQRSMLERYLEAFHRYDVDALTALLREDATLSMPPYSLWLRGRATIAEWLRGRGLGCRGSCIVPTVANGSPAFGQYRVAAGGGYRAWALIVLELDGDCIASWNSFLDVETLFPHFELPLELPRAANPRRGEARVEQSQRLR